MVGQGLLPSVRHKTYAAMYQISSTGTSKSNRNWEDRGSTNIEILVIFTEKQKSGLLIGYVLLIDTLWYM